MARPAGKEDALPGDQPGAITQCRIRGNPQRAGLTMKLDVTLETTSRATRQERSDDSEIGIDIQPEVGFDALHEADAAAPNHRGTRTIPVETFNRERAVGYMKPCDLRLCIAQL